MSDGLPPSMTDLLAPPAQPESSVLTEQPQRLVNFLTTGVPPPSGLYVSPMDSIRVELISQNAGIPVLVKMRYVTPDGEIQYEEETITSAALPSTSLTDYKLGECFLLSIALVSGQSSTQRGRVYASISYSRAFGGPQVAYMHTLVQGYVTTIQRVSWPVIQADYPLNGPGLPVYLTLTGPAAGANFTYTVPNNIRMRVMSLFFHLVTSATVANRVVTVQAIAGGTAVAYSAAQAAQAASSTVNYTAAAGYPSVAAGDGSVYIPLPFQYIFQAGMSLQVNVIALAATDQISNVNCSFEEWVDM